MEDFTNLTQEQIFAAEAYFNLATMVGKCLEISVYQLNHPDYKPNIFVTPSGNDEEEPEQEEPSASVGQQEPTPISSGRIRSNELSDHAQMHQLFCLYDERLRIFWAHLPFMRCSGWPPASSPMSLNPRMKSPPRWTGKRLLLPGLS